jgi:hypothetical protein
MVRHLIGNKNGYKSATDRQHLAAWLQNYASCDASGQAAFAATSSTKWTEGISEGGIPI